jgi:hypothetical protein
VKVTLKIIARATFWAIFSQTNPVTLVLNGTPTESHPIIFPSKTGRPDWTCFPYWAIVYFGQFFITKVAIPTYSKAQ